MRDEVARSKYWRNFMVRVRWRIVAMKLQKLKEKITGSGNSTINQDNEDKISNFLLSSNENVRIIFLRAVFAFCQMVYKEVIAVDFKMVCIFLGECMECF